MNKPQQQLKDLNAVGGSFNGIIEEAEDALCNIFESFASLEDGGEFFGLVASEEDTKPRLPSIRDVTPQNLPEGKEESSSQSSQVAAEPVLLPKPVSSLSVIDDQESNDSTKPRRPLSSYNLFFQVMRERLIAGKTEVSFSPEDVERVAITRRKQMENENGLPKRKHRKSHGKISFAELARTIANTWKTLDPTLKDILQERAAVEKARYLRELEEWTKKSEAEKKKLASRRAVVSMPPPMPPVVSPHAPTPIVSSAMYNRNMAEMQRYRESMWNQQQPQQQQEVWPEQEQSMHSASWNAWGDDDAKSYERSKYGSMRNERGLSADEGPLFMRGSMKSVQFPTMGPGPQVAMDDVASSSNVFGSLMSLDDGEGREENASAPPVTAVEAFELSKRTGMDPSHIMMILQEYKSKEHQRANSMPPMRAPSSYGQESYPMQQHQRSHSYTPYAPIAKQQYQQRQARSRSNVQHRRQTQPSHMAQRTDVGQAVTAFPDLDEPTEEEDRQMRALLATFDDNKC